MYCKLQHSVARILFFTAYTTAQHCFKSLLYVSNLASDAVNSLFIVILHQPQLSLSSNVCVINIFLSLVLSYAHTSHCYFPHQVWYSLGNFLWGIPLRQVLKLKTTKEKIVSCCVSSLRKVLVCKIAFINKHRI